MQRYMYMYKQLNKVFQMIFPKPEMRIEQCQNDELQKDALELIISLYLERKKDEDITFLRSNFHSTKKFAEMIRSDWMVGLGEGVVEINRILYGENCKYLPDKFMTINECIFREFVNPYIVSSLLLFVICLIFGFIRNIKQMISSSYIILMVCIIVSVIHVLQSSYYNYQLLKNSKEKTKKKLYKVIRNGNLFQIQQCAIVVGDIIQLGLKERVPVTGIMVSEGEIYVREKDSAESIRPKTSLENCCRRIEDMSTLDLRLSFEQESLPSPIVLRGSELLNDTSYSIMAISVTEEKLLRDFGYKCEDGFNCRSYDEWTEKLIGKWENCSIYIIALIIVVLTFCKYTEENIKKKIEQDKIKIGFEVLLEIGILIWVINPINIKIYLNNIFIKFITRLKVIQNYQRLFAVNRIICNQRCIIEYDNVQVLQIALCENEDLITPKETENTNMITHELIIKIYQIFNINMMGERNKEKQKMNKIIHLNKKLNKIISIVSNQKIFNNKYQKNVIKQLNYQNIINKYNNICSYPNQFNCNKFITKNQHINSLNLLKFPSLKNQQQNENQYYKQQQNEKNNIDIKFIKDNLVQLKQNHIRTYYLIPYDLDNLQYVKYIVINGQIQVFNSNYKQRMVILAKKMKVLYGLASVMVGYNQGEYSNQPLQTLVCILGVVVKQNNEVIKMLSEIEPIGIKSLILIQQVNENQYEQQESEQKNIYQEYKYRNWLTTNDIYTIYNMENIKVNLKRLVCKKCWIGNCDCREKIYEVSNIQPFIQISNKIKIVYNVNLSNLNILQCAFKQLQYQPICLMDNNQSACQIIESIVLCLKFIQTLKRSVILYYAVAIVYCTVSILFWVKNQHVVKSVHIGNPSAFLFCFLTLAMFCEIKIRPEKLDQVQKNPTIIRKEQTLFIYLSCLIIVIATQLFNYLHYLIPEFRDNFDQLMLQHHMDPYHCKYGPNLSVISFINNSQCQTAEIGIQYSRLSTIISFYIYLSMWILMVVFHHNFKSIFSIFYYIVALGLYVILMEFLPQATHTYSEGLTLNHYLIVVVSAIATQVLAYILSNIIIKLSIMKYFTEQLQNKIIFKHENEYHYSKKLKLYYLEKNWQTIKAHERQNLFNSR